MVLDASRIKGRWQDDYFLRTGHLATLKGDNMEIKNVQIPFALFRQLVSYHLMEDQRKIKQTSIYGYDTNRITYVTERFYHHFMFFDKVNVSKRQTHIERT